MMLRRPFLLVSCAILGLGLAGPALALSPYRVADIDPTFRSASSSPNGYFRVGARAVFRATAPGLGLWSTDGTPQGTVRLFAAPSTSIEPIAATGDLLFVQTCDSQACRLRVTDGTPAGTRVLAAGGTFFAGVAAGARRIYFTRSTAPLGREPWTSDGTVAGTRLVKDVQPGPDGSIPFPLIASGNRLWFFALDGLWTSNGTGAGTRRIATVGNGEIRAAAGLGQRLLYFAAAAPGAEVRLFASDGTAAGTKALGVTIPANEAVDPFAVAGGNAYFTRVKDEGSTFEREVWATDGTAARTRKVASFGFYDFSPPLVPAGNRVAFVAGDAEHGLELWSSDGTAAGTRGIDVCSGSCSGLDAIGAADGGRIWFAGTTPASGTELWTSDLTPGGTRLVKDLAPGSGSSYPDQFLAGGGKVFLSTHPPFGGDQLWSSDGTVAGTLRLAQAPDEDSRLRVQLGAVVGARGFFALDDGSHGVEPWVSDGKLSGTRLIRDLDPSQVSGSFPHLVGSAGGRIYFLTQFDRADAVPELWSSDGTAAGTRRAVRFDDRRISSAFAIGGADLGNRIAVLFSTSFQVAQIWISDSTVAGTFRLDGPDFLPTGKFRAVSGRLFFEASDGSHGTELWTTDGTAAGTVRLSDFSDPFPFPDGPQNAPFRALGDRLAFLARDSFGRLEPWVSDGTVSGTRRLAEVYPALVASFFELSSEIVAAGGKYFYVSGEESEVGTEAALWVSDLTSAGTHEVGALEDSAGVPAEEAGLFALGDQAILFYRTFSENGFYRSEGAALTAGPLGTGAAFGGTGLEPRVWNGRLVYRGNDSRLWSTDGTVAGTQKLRYPDGTEILNPAAFAVLGGRLAFSAFTGLWDTDGTPQGTVRRVAPRGSTEIFDFLRAGERIYFPGYDAATGTELWALRP